MTQKELLILEERIVFQISLKRGRNVRKYMTHKTKAIILKGKNIQPAGR